MLHKTDAAIADYTAFIDFPNAPVKLIAQALYNRGICYSQQNKTDAEIADYTAVINLPNASVEKIVQALNNRGVLYWQQSKHIAAHADFAQVLSLDSVSSEQKTKALFAIVETMVTTHSYSEVIAAQKRAFIEGDSSVDAYGGTPNDLLKMLLQLGCGQWPDYIRGLLALFIEYKQLDRLAAGLVKNIAALASMDLSHSQLNAWYQAWYEAASEENSLTVSLNAIKAAIESIKTKNSRPLLQSLPLEIRELVLPMVEHLWTK